MALTGTIDIGTNSVLLLVTELQAGQLVAVREVATVTRLGQGVDKTRRLAPEAMQRTLTCLEEYRSILSELRVSAVQAVGTSALRDAEGASEFLLRAEQVLGVPVEVISGEREAGLAFQGALSDLGVSGQVLVIDIGGGSTEFIVGEVRPEGTQVHSAVSLNIGSVRLTERHLRQDPPSAAELAALRADVACALAEVVLPASVGTVVGVAGTVTTVAAVITALPRFDANVLHGARIARSDLDTTAAKLSQMQVNARAETAGMNPGRADVIVAGAIILQMSLLHAHAESFVISARGLRWGLAQELQR